MCAIHFPTNNQKKKKLRMADPFCHSDINNHTNILQANRISFLGNLRNQVAVCTKQRKK